MCRLQQLENETIDETETRLDYQRKRRTKQLEEGTAKERERQLEEKRKRRKKQLDKELKFMFRIGFV